MVKDICKFCKDGHHDRLVSIGVAPIRQYTHVHNKNSNTQGSLCVCSFYSFFNPKKLYFFFIFDDSVELFLDFYINQYYPHMGLDANKTCLWS